MRNSTKFIMPLIESPMFVLFLAIALVNTARGASGDPLLAAEIARCNTAMSLGKTSLEALQEWAPERFEAWREAAIAGDPAGLWLVANCFDFGVLVDMDTEHASALFQMADDDPMAQFSLGLQHLDGHGEMEQNFGRAAAYFRAAAERGYSVAQNELGAMYERGLGMEKNEVLASEWYRKAAAQGHAIAQSNLGVMYLHGRGVLRDEAVAAHWITLAANQGCALAQYNMGVLHFNGYGVPASDAEAAAWITLAAGQGLAMAQNLLGLMHLEGRGVALHQETAVAHFRNAAAQGNSEALWNYGRALVLGEGILQDIELGVSKIRQAADAGVLAALEAVRKLDAQPSQTLTPTEEMARMLGLERYYPVGNHPEGSGAWWADQIENDPLMRFNYGIPDEDN